MAQVQCRSCQRVFQTQYAPAPATPCPACRQPITIQVHQIVDVGEQPELKQLLLAGRLNSFTCPHCRNAGALATPFFYHDAEKELALRLQADGISATASLRVPRETARPSRAAWWK